MLKFSRLQSKKVYRVMDKFVLPFTYEKLVGRGNLITVFGENMSDTSEFFKRPHIKFKYYMRYYIDRYVRFQLLNKKILIHNDQDGVWAKGFGLDYPEIRLSKTVGATNNYNTVYEIGQYMEILNTDKLLNNKNYLIKNQIKFDLIINKLKSISQQFTRQPAKYFILPLDNYIENPRNTSMWVQRSYLRDNNMMAFIRTMLSPENISKLNELKDWTFVFVNMNELFYFKCTEFDIGSFDLIKRLFFRFKSRRGAINTEITSPEIDEDDDDLDLYDSAEDDSKEKEQDIEPEEPKVKGKATMKPIGSKSDNHKELTHLGKPKTPKSKIDETNKKILDAKVNKVEHAIDDLKISTDKKAEIKTAIQNKGKDAIDNDNIVANEDKVEKAVERETKKQLLDLVTPNVSVERLARMKTIEKNMGEIKLDNQTINEIKEHAESRSIDNHEIKADVINKKLTNIKFDNFEKNYNNKLLNYDLVNILTHFSQMDRPLYLISLNKEDTSTTMDKLYTYTAVYEDERGKRHTLKFDYPKFIDNKYVHINHSDKQFINQIVPLPVTKISPDQVQISSNYKKIFLMRFGKNISDKLVKFNKLVPDIDSRVLTFVIGNNTKNNTKYMTTIEYDNLGQRYSKITLKNEGIEIYLNQKEIRRICDEYGLAYKDDNIPFAIQTKNNKKSVILLDSNTDKIIGYGLSPIDFIIEMISKNSPKFKEAFKRAASSKRMMYTRAKIAGKLVPIAIVLGYLCGLEPLLNKLNIKWEFSDKRRLLKDNESIIDFKDGHLIYENTRFANSLLLNGFTDIPTKEYNFLQFSGKDVYHALFSMILGRKNFGADLEAFNQEFVDPITKEILEDCNLPTEFVDIVIYANSLLENNTYDNDGDTKNFRIRSNELVNAHLYNLLSKAYEAYRNTADAKNPQPFTIKRSALINELFNSQIFEESSTLSPLLEVDRMRTTSYKGLAGCNTSRAFTLQKRAYNDSMLGVFAQSSPVSANIGVSRVLSLNPNVKSLRGYIEPGSRDNEKNLDETNMLSPVELLLPLTPTNDDPDRVAMASTQSKHTISTVCSDTPLFGYGYDKVLASTISNRFAFKAKTSGVISEVNDELGYMILKYDDGTSDVVDLTCRQGLNTGSGFYITNKLTPNYEEGKHIKEGDVVACNRDFFDFNNVTGDTVYKSGPLARVALIHGSPVFEDSTILTEEFAKKMSSYVTQKRDVKLGKNSNIYKMVNIGDEVKVTDPLMIFDESYQDEYLNKMLEKMSEQEKKDIIESGRTSISSKHNGKIIDIKIYYTVPKEELSPSLRKIINSYEKTIKKRLENFKANNINIKDMTTLNEEDSYIEPVNGKIKGIKMEDNHVLIEFYIRELDRFAGGDKCTFGTALKGIDQTLIPEGQEPFLASDPNVKIDAFCAVNGYYARMTNSFPISMAINTVLIGAENKIRDMLKK